MNFTLFIAIFTFTASFSYSLFAAPVPLKSGLYEYKDFKVMTKKRFETVYSASHIGKNRLDELKSQKYNCEYKTSQIHLCSAFLTVKNTKAEITKHVEKKVKDLILSAEEASGAISLIDESSYLKTYEVPQKIEFNGLIYSNYRYLVAPEIERLFLGTPAAETFVFGSSGETLLSLPLSVTESKTSYLRYLVLAEFSLKAK